MSEDMFKTYFLVLEDTATIQPSLSTANRLCGYFLMPWKSQYIFHYFRRGIQSVYVTHSSIIELNWPGAAFFADSAHGFSFPYY